MRPRAQRARARAPAGARAHGFTLVEIVVVIVILALIGGVAVSSWASLLPNQQFNSAVRDLSETLYGTRSDAIARNRQFRIYYDLDADTYKVRTPFRPDGGFAAEDDELHIWTHETDLAEAGIDLVQVTIDDVPYTDGVVYVRFDPLGAAAHHVIQLRQTRFERDFTLEALPLTGEIRMHDGIFARNVAEEADFK